MPMPTGPTLIRTTAPRKDTLTAAIAGTIRAFSARRQITRADMGRLLDVSPYRMGRIWNGNRITVEDMARIGQILDVKPSDLLTRD